MILSVLKICLSINFYLLMCNAFGIVYVVYYLYGYFGRSDILDFMSVIIVTTIFAIPIIIWNYFVFGAKTKFKFRNITIITVVICFLIATTAIVLTKGLCVCYFNDNIDVVSTSFTRSRSLNTQCPSKSICHVYATLP
jgi:hypothetical protein